MSSARSTATVFNEAAQAVVASHTCAIFDVFFSNFIVFVVNFICWIIRLFGGNSFGVKRRSDMDCCEAEMFVGLSGIHQLCQIFLSKAPQQWKYLHCFRFQEVME